MSWCFHSPPATLHRAYPWHGRTGYKLTGLSSWHNACDVGIPGFYATQCYGCEGKRSAGDCSSDARATLVRLRYLSCMHLARCTPDLTYSAGVVVQRGVMTRLSFGPITFAVFFLTIRPVCSWRTGEESRLCLYRVVFPIWITLHLIIFHSLQLFFSACVVQYTGRLLWISVGCDIIPEPNFAPTKICT